MSYLNPEARAGFITKEEVFTDIPHCPCCASENPWQKLFTTRAGTIYSCGGCETGRASETTTKRGSK